MTLFLYQDRRYHESTHINTSSRSENPSFEVCFPSTAETHGRQERTSGLWFHHLMNAPFLQLGLSYQWDQCVTCLRNSARNTHLFRKSVLIPEAVK